MDCHKSLQHLNPHSLFYQRWVPFSKYPKHKHEGDDAQLERKDEVECVISVVVYMEQGGLVTDLRSDRGELQHMLPWGNKRDGYLTQT